MINGFDEETAPLSDNERELLPYVIPLLEHCVGKKNALKNKDISFYLSHTPGAKIDGPRIRKIINHIRQNDLVSCLIATSNGYYVAETEQELRDYEDSLNARATAIWQIRGHIMHQREARFSRPTQGVLF